MNLNGFLTITTLHFMKFLFYKLNFFNTPTFILTRFIRRRKKSLELENGILNFLFHIDLYKQIWFVNGEIYYIDDQNKP